MKAYPFFIVLLVFSTACALEEIPAEGVIDINFTITPKDGHPVTACPFPCTVIIDNISTPQDLTDFRWDLGIPGEPPAFGRLPDGEDEVTYDEVGNYIIELVAELNTGDSDPVTKVLNVIDPLAPPVPDFTFTNDGCFAPCTVTFTNTTINATRYFWDFDDGSDIIGTTSMSPIDYEFLYPGEYNVKLEAWNELGSDVKKDSVFYPVTIAIRTFEDFESNMGIGKAVFQLDDQSYFIVGREVSSKRAFMLRTLPGGSSMIDPDYPKYLNFAEEFEDVNSAVLLSNGDVAILGTAIDPATNRQRMVYGRVNTSGEEATATKFVFDPSGRDIVGARIKETPGQEIMLLGTATDPASGDKDVFIRRINLDNTGGPPAQFISAAGGDDLSGTDLVSIGNDQWAIVANRSGSAFAGSLVITDNEGVPINSDYPQDLGAGHASTFAIVQKNNGNLIISGLNLSLEVYLAEFPKLGGTNQWSIIAQSNGLVSQLQTNMGGGQLVLFGRFNDQAGMIGYDESGNSLFPLRPFGSTSNSQLLAGVPTIDGGWLSVGYSSSSSNLLYVKTDALGQIH